jgi:hypothetical protein
MVKIQIVGLWIWKQTRTLCVFWQILESVYFVLVVDFQLDHSMRIKNHLQTCVGPPFGNYSVQVSIRIGPYSKITFMVHGWPRHEWEAAMADNVIHQDSMIDYLVGTIAARHTTATIKFQGIAFVAKQIRGVLNRCLTPKRQTEVCTEREIR